MKVLVLLTLLTASQAVFGTSCPCPNDHLCLPLEEAARRYPDDEHVKIFQQKKYKSEVFAFVLECDESVWSKFDWNKLTTIALAGFEDPQLSCHAHENGVRVVPLGNIAKEKLSNATERTDFVNTQTKLVEMKYMDGINIDFEDEIEDGSPEQEGYSSLIEELSASMHEAMPGSQVSVDVAWSPDNIDRRFYNYSSLGQHANILFVMSYDEQSQIWDEPCSARANSGYLKSMGGVQEYIDMGVPPAKLVMGLPWYGYKYPCQQITQDGTCILAEVPFRGCNCSDAAGKEFPYSYMKETQLENNVTENWDVETATPHYQVTLSDGITYEMRYDSPLSLYLKVVGARIKGLRGVGMWTANFLDNGDSEEAERQRDTMWATMP